MKLYRWLAEKFLARYRVDQREGELFPQFKFFVWGYISAHNPKYGIATYWMIKIPWCVNHEYSDPYDFGKRTGICTPIIESFYIHNKPPTRYRLYWQPCEDMNHD